MTKKFKWLTIMALASSATLLSGNGCLGAFWNGLWNQNWPNKWLGLGLDILKEDIFS
jgi:hypothetical protein